MIVMPKDFESSLRKSRELLLAGDRNRAIALARQCVEANPNSVPALRALSYALTNYTNYRHDRAQCRELVATGSIAEALACSRAAIDLDGTNFEDFLQVGYCLTALGDMALASESIRRATDLASLEYNPKLFSKMDASWVPLAPSFLIIGVAKGGTTSLHKYLSQHPKVLAPVEKEIDYFSQPERGYEWYLSHFPRRPDGEERFVTGEACVANFNDWNAPKLVRQTIPNAKLIAVLRDPVERAISHYYNNKRVGTERRELEEAISQELSLLDCRDDQLDDNLREYWKSQKAYVALGLYSKFLERWMTLSTDEELLILISEELYAQPVAEMRKVLHHIGLKPQPSAKYRKHHAGVYDHQEKDMVRTKLAAFYGKHNERFYELLGRRLDWQSVNRPAPGAGLATSASRARIFGKRGDWEKSAGEWRICLREYPWHPDRTYWLPTAGTCFIKAGDAVAARAAFEELQLRDPESPIGWEGLAKTAQVQGDVDEARVGWEECLMLFPSHPRRPVWMSDCAQLLLKSGDWRRAEVVLTRLVEEVPDSAFAHSGLARAAQACGDRARAIQLWDKYLSLFPEHQDRRWWLGGYGNLLLEAGLPDKAETVFRDLSGLSPDDPAALAGLARALRQKGEMQAALSVIQDVVARFPNHAERKWWLPFEGHLLLDLGLLKEAEELFSRCWEEFPNNPGGLSGLALVARKQGDSRKAVKLLTECIAQFPGDGDQRWWLAVCGDLAFEQADWESADTSFRSLKDRFPDIPSGWSGLARLAAEQGDWKQARDLFGECLKRFSGHEQSTWWQQMVERSTAALSATTPHTGE